MVRADSIRCLERNEALEFLTGRTLGDVSERIVEHLEVCAACQQTMRLAAEESDTIDRLMQRIDGDYESESAFLNVRRGLSRKSPPVSADFELPLTLGQYELQSPLGHGGMGRVFRGVHNHLKRPVAVKLLAPERLNDVESVEQFYREMEAIGRLDHPHIVQATDAAQVDGLPFLVMEYVDGPTLSQLLQRIPQFAFADACEIIRQAASGLQFAKEHDLVHCDIKPSNLILSRQGKVKILDLGLARLKSADESLPEKITGTVDYMSPEQWLGNPLDSRTDIYGLGCTLYKLLTGHAPFELAGRTTRERREAHLTAEIPSISGSRTDAPPGFDEILQKMLAKKPGERYATPRDVEDVLLRFCEGSDLRALIEPASIASNDTVRFGLLDDTTLPQPAIKPSRRWWLKGLVVLGVGLPSGLYALVSAIYDPDAGWITVKLDEVKTFISRDPGCELATRRIGNLDALQVRSQRMTYVPLGKTKKESVRLRAMYTSKPTGFAGIYFNSNTLPRGENLACAYHCVRVRIDETESIQEAFLQWEVHEFPNGHMSHSRFVLESWPVQFDGSCEWQNLEISYGLKGLTVIWNGDKIAEGFQADKDAPATAWDMNGEFGLLLEHGELTVGKFSTRDQ